MHIVYIIYNLKVLYVEKTLFKTSNFFFMNDSLVEVSTWTKFQIKIWKTIFLKTWGLLQGSL
jgi:hypothetical protein